MTRILALLLVLAVLVAPACGLATPYAARVGSAEISEADLERELEAILENQQYLLTLESSGARVRGEGSGTLDTAFVARVLTIRIFFEVVRQEFNRRDLSVTDAVRRVAEEAVISQVGGPAVYQAFSDDYREESVRRIAEAVALQLSVADVSIAPEDLRAYYREHEEEFVETCVTHILLTPDGAVDEDGLQAEAEALLAEIAAGADIATLAAEHSDDQGSAAQGGQLGCRPPGQYVPEFEEAVAGLDVGEVSGLVRTQFGIHIIKVTDRRTAAFDDIENQIRQQLIAEGEQPFNQMLFERLGETDVEVNPRYGSFERAGAQPQVVPPAGPAGEGQRAPATPVAPTPLP